MKNSMIIFDEFIKNTKLPSTAKEQLPGILSDKIKTTLMSRFDAEEIIKIAIDEIDHGSVEKIEELIKKILQKRRKIK